ncbi:hypothetical protein ebA6701 [Aromatoleum aromaticum EbN1]|uniref:Uncharacterized protein n=1 Tax=Aromatoleum aromaticum (strain DSM 19018 / LMG 30748 / EbN1) TaxID=76114 RepID=Q5NYA5_AROAE|nr:hypothetical protein ebA6701 [Aromatoleum aromaticum EbN1]
MTRPIHPCVLRFSSGPAESAPSCDSPSLLLRRPTIAWSEITSAPPIGHGIGTRIEMRVASAPGWSVLRRRGMTSASRCGIHGISDTRRRSSLPATGRPSVLNPALQNRWVPWSHTSNHFMLSSIAASDHFIHKAGSTPGRPPETLSRSPARLRFSSDALFITAPSHWIGVPKHKHCGFRAKDLIGNRWKPHCSRFRPWRPADEV